MKKIDENITYIESFTIELYLLSGMSKDIHGLAMQTKDPHKYKIGLNASMTDTQKLAAFLHEMTHIYNHDHDSGDHVNTIEVRVRQQLMDALELLKQEESER